MIYQSLSYLEKTFTIRIKIEYWLNVKLFQNYCSFSLIISPILILRMPPIFITRVIKNKILLSLLMEQKIK